MNPDVSIGRLRQAFVLGLGLITVVIVAAQVTIARSPDDRATDAHIVNLAGRQRMLSQQIAKTAIAIHEGAPDREDAARIELDRALGTFARAHHALRQGDPELGLPGDNPTIIVQQFAMIDRWVRDLTAAGEALLLEPRASHRAQRLLDIMHLAESEFIPLMDRIVTTYEQEATARVQRFHTLENLILALTIFSLAAVAVGVIRPVIRSVETEMHGRELAEAKLREQAVELRDTARKAEAAAQAKARFLASMSHEMRTPLNGIVGMAQVLETSDLDAEQREGLEVIQSSSEALLALISDVLDIAKIEAGRLDLESVAFDLHDLLEHTLSIISASATARGLQVACAVAPGVPTWVRGDPTRLRQVLLNLLSNAVKFTESGQVTLRAVSRIDTAGADPIVRFEVADTGIGIEPGQKSRLFQPFTQADESTTRRFGGTGLGLAISQRLVQGMGGTLDLESTVGQGTTFRFELTLATTAPIEPIVSTDVEDVTAPLAVLLVDDLPVNRMVARKLLERLGHTVDEAEDGIEAVARVTAGRYDVVLMDLQMPRLDGVGATAQIRQLGGDRAQTPIVAVTANAQSGDREQALAAGLDDYLAKPISREKLGAVLARVTRATTPA